MIKIKSYLIIPAIAALTLTACGDGKGEDPVDGGIDSTKTDTQTINPVSETFFQVPSPGEMLTFIKMVGGKNNKNSSFLNPTDNQKNYADSKSRALNFGIYSCDLSYCSIFEMGSEALKYFKVVKQMGDQIGVSTAIKPEMMKRLENNVGAPDSLAVITDDIYFSSFETLESSQQGPVLAQVVAGGWIESLFIATNLAKYEAGSPMVERLADQKYTLENLVEFLKKHESDASVKEIKTDFEGLLAEFNKISEKDMTGSNSKSNGKMVMGGGKQLNMTEDVYKAIVEKVRTIRNAYTQTK